MLFVIEAVSGNLFGGSVHSTNLTVGSRMLHIGLALLVLSFYAVFIANVVKGMPQPSHASFTWQLSPGRSGSVLQDSQALLTILYSSDEPTAVIVSRLLTPRPEGSLPFRRKQRAIKPGIKRLKHDHI